MSAEWVRCFFFSSLLRLLLPSPPPFFFKARQSIFHASPWNELTPRLITRQNIPQALNLGRRFSALRSFLSPWKRALKRLLMLWNSWSWGGNSPFQTLPLHFIPPQPPFPRLPKHLFFSGRISNSVFKHHWQKCLVSAATCLCLCAQELEHRWIGSGASFTLCTLRDWRVFYSVHA